MKYRLLPSSFDNNFDGHPRLTVVIRLDNYRYVRAQPYSHIFA